MTQKQIEQTRVIALYDKWLIIPEGTYAECHRQTIWFGHGGKFDCYHDVTAAYAMPYLTDLNALHKVAMDVMERLYTHPKSVNIQAALFKSPINGEYIDLFNAVYDAIVFLNENKLAKR